MLWRSENFLQPIQCSMDHELIGTVVQERTQWFSFWCWFWLMSQMHSLTSWRMVRPELWASRNPKTSLLLWSWSSSLLSSLLSGRFPEGVLVYKGSFFTPKIARHSNDILLVDLVLYERWMELFLKCKIKKQPEKSKCLAHGRPKENLDTKTGHNLGDPPRTISIHRKSAPGLRHHVSSDDTSSQLNTAVAPPCLVITNESRKTRRDLGGTGWTGENLNS